MSKPTVAPVDHDFRHDLYDAVNDCERQRQFRKLAPIPFGSVLIARDDMDEAEVRWHLRTMKEIGLNSIKQFMACPRWPNAKLEAMALEEGLVPWWYGEGGWEPVTDELCHRLGIDPKKSMAEIRVDPRMEEHQRGVLAERFGREKMKLGVEAQVGMFSQKKTSISASYGADAELPEWALEEFLEWCKQRYDGDIDRLNRAWNMDVHKFRGADDEQKSGFSSWDEITHEHATLKRDYGRTKDIFRFKSDLRAKRVADICRQARERDPHEPHRSGGEMGIFLPFASRGTDMESIARALKETGSFYPSIHLCWHFEETFFEVARPVYMQALFVTDLNKGGWTAPWESTGGPQQTSGSKAHLFPFVKDMQPGYTVDAGVMTQLLYSYLAAGCKGAGLWAWNARQAGVEGGEYALLDRNEQVCDRTRRVGRIAVKANELREELWAAHKEPQVGVLMDWNNEATWAAMSQFNRTVFKHYPIEARIGALRLLIDNSVPCEYVTGLNLHEGLAERYPIIYLPGFLGLDTDLLPILKRYAEAGGRVVADMPCGCYDHTGRMLRTHRGTDYEALFGTELADVQYSGNNVHWDLEGEPIRGYTADLVPTTARVLASYGNGRPAVTENPVGKGSAVLLGWESGRTCYHPGRSGWQKRAVKYLLGGAAPYYVCEGRPWAYRLCAPEADHYFLINEGAPSEARFTRLPHDYADCRDVLTEESVDLAAEIPVEGDGGRWLRCVKKG